MAKSAITLAAPPADEAADALLVKPKQSKSSNTKGILALGLLAFALDKDVHVPSVGSQKYPSYNVDVIYL